MSDRQPDLACQTVVELVTDYLEGALDVPDSTQLEQHLVLCDACVSYVDQHRNVLAALRKLPAAEPGAPAPLRGAALEAFRKLRPGDGS